MTVVGSAVAALIGFLGSLALFFVTGQAARRGTEKELRQRAYADLLVASLETATRVRTLTAVVSLRSGAREELGLVLGLRKPLDAMTLHDWLNQGFGPLVDAWSRTWAYGTPSGVQIANRLVDACEELLRAATDVRAQGYGQKLRRAVIGVPSNHIAQTLDEKLKAIASARRDLTNHMREETRRDLAELFYHL